MNPTERDFVIACDPSQDRAKCWLERSPCITKSGSRGQRITSRARRMKTEEMVRLQGILPNQITRAVSWNDLGNQIGNSMSQNVIDRIFWSLLPAAGLGPNPIDDRWRNGIALQEIRNSRKSTSANETPTPIPTLAETTITNTKLYEFVQYDSSPTYELRSLPKSSYAPSWENIVTVIHRCAGTYQILFHENVSDANRSDKYFWKERCHCDEGIIPVQR